MQNQTLFEILNENFGDISTVRNLALSNDKNLLKFLLTNAKFRAEFFENIAVKENSAQNLAPRENFENSAENSQNSALIFQKEKFLEFLNLKVRDFSYTKFANKIGLALHGGGF